jgi:hypothetical protein
VSMNSCCRKAVDALEHARHKKNKEREAIKQQMSKRKQRTKVKIEEIGTEL